MNVTPIDRERLGKALAIPDLTDAAHGPHALQLLVADAVAALRARWRCEVVVYRSDPVVSLADNYERLGYPPDATARDARYTRYVSETHVLRTHTSALVPGALRSIARARYADVLLACPGIVYRRDAIDRLHVGEPHQLDLWRVRRGRLDEAELREMVSVVVAALLPGCDYRSLPAEHPYTENGLEIEADAGGGWVEIAECGLASPRVLASAGLAPGEYAGLAMGIGLDRMLMLRKRIADIRLLRAPDERIASQMRDLEPYRSVSTLPPVHRDLSLAVREDLTPEKIGDRVRGVLGDRADDVEAVEVLAETPRSALPPQAVERIGIQPGQKNVLVRVTVRHPSRTLTAEEANRLRDEVYEALHEGTAHQWATR